MARMALENVSDPDAEITQVLAFLRETFPNLDPDDPDPLIDLPAIAELAGVSKGTPMIWRQRSKPDYDGPGRMDGRQGRKQPFPAPDDERYADKPQWRAIGTILPWLCATRKWPRGTVARPETRGSRLAA